jgi:hypothetical protein
VRLEPTGGLVRGTARPLKGDSLYHEALRMLLRSTSPQSQDVRRIHAGFAVLYDAWGRTDQAAEHHRIAGPYLTPF